MLNTKLYRDRLSKWTKRVICVAMMAVAVWGVVLTPVASAVGSQAAADVVSDRAATELDRVAGAGTSDQLEGAARDVVGKAKRDVGRVQDKVDDLDGLGNRVEGAADSVRGKVQRDVGRTKSAASDLGDDVEDKANSLVDSVKDLFD